MAHELGLTDPLHGSKISISGRETPIVDRNKMKRPSVWIIKEQSMRNSTGSEAMDYSPAMNYGEIRFITRNDMPLYPRSSVQMNWDLDVASFVREYDPLTDFIITTGQPTAIFAVGHQLGIAGKTPRYLVWRREDNRYRVLDNSLPETLTQ